MIHRSAVPLSLLEVLMALRNKTAAAGFSLAGGTSLALGFGHRLPPIFPFFSFPSAIPLVGSEMEIKTASPEGLAADVCSKVTLV